MQCLDLVRTPILQAWQRSRGMLRDLKGAGLVQAKADNNHYPGHCTCGNIHLQRSRPCNTMGNNAELRSRLRTSNGGRDSVHLCTILTTNDTPCQRLFQIFRGIKLSHHKFFWFKGKK